MEDHLDKAATAQNPLAESEKTLIPADVSGLLPDLQSVVESLRTAHGTVRALLADDKTYDVSMLTGLVGAVQTAKAYAQEQSQAHGSNPPPILPYTSDTAAPSSRTVLTSVFDRADAMEDAKRFGQHYAQMREALQESSSAITVAKTFAVAATGLALELAAARRGISNRDDELRSANARYDELANSANARYDELAKTVENLSYIASFAYSEHDDLFAPMRLMGRVSNVFVGAYDLTKSYEPIRESFESVPVQEFKRSLQQSLDVPLYMRLAAFGHEKDRVLSGAELYIRKPEHDHVLFAMLSTDRDALYEEQDRPLMAFSLAPKGKLSPAPVYAVDEFARYSKTSPVALVHWMLGNLQEHFLLAQKQLAQKDPMSALSVQPSSSHFLSDFQNVACVSRNDGVSQRYLVALSTMPMDWDGNVLRVSNNIYLR